MNVEFLDLSRQIDQLQVRVIPGLRRVLHSGQFLGGAEVSELEAELAACVQARETVALSSGGAALRLTLVALGIGPGDEVITPALAPPAAADAVRYTGATPVFVDVDPVSRTLNPDRIDEAVTAHSRVVLAVHLYGQPADMDRIGHVAETHDLIVIEDASQAVGATVGRRRVGSIGQAACFSFHPHMPLGGWGDGGAVATSDPQLAECVRWLRGREAGDVHQGDPLDFTYHMHALQAAVLRVKLAELDTWTDRRREIADRYREALRACGLLLPTDPPWGRGVFFRYAAVTPRACDLGAHLAAAGVATGCHATGAEGEHCPNAARLARDTIWLPVYPEMTDREVETVVDAVDRWTPSRDEAPAEPAPPRLAGNVRYRRLGDAIRAFWLPRHVT